MRYRKVWQPAFLCNHMCRNHMCVVREGLFVVPWHRRRGAGATTRVRLTKQWTRCPVIKKIHKMCITSIPMFFSVLDFLRPCRNWETPKPSSASFNCVIIPYNQTQARPRPIVCDNSANSANLVVAIIIKYCPRPFHFKIIFPNWLHNITLHYYVDNRIV